MAAFPGVLVRTAGLIAALALVVPVLAGCVAVPPRAPVETAPSVSVPQPPGVSGSPPPSPSTSPANATCDAPASLRPNGPPPPPGQPPAGSTMARIVQRGRLIAGVDQNTYPFGFRDPFTGQLEGFDIDMLRAVARALFGAPDKIQFRAITSADRILVLEQGEVDIVARTFTIDCSRAEQVGFSSVYFQAGQRVLVNSNSTVRDIGDLGGKKVCATKGSTSLDSLTRVASQPRLVSVDNWTDCLVLMQQGQVDAISTDDTILAGLAAQDPYTKIVGPKFTDEPYGLAVPKLDTDFVRFINAVLDQVRANGTWTNSYQHWIADRLGPVPAPPTPHYQD
jgi:polar amino acid transport system substrate-binding protein